MPAECWTIFPNVAHLSFLSWGEGGGGGGGRYRALPDFLLPTGIVY